MQREVTRSNHYFLKKFGIIKGNSSEEWKEGIQIWLDQGLLNKSWKWRASRGRFKSSKNRRRIKRLKSVISGENILRLKPHSPNKRKQTSTATTESEANSKELQIYIFKNKAQFGPYPLDEIEKFLVNSQLNLDDLAFYKGCENWIKVSELPNLKFKQEPKKPEKLIPKKEHQVVQKPTLRKPDEKSQRNRSEKVNVSHESNHSQIQIEPRKKKKKFLILGSASLIVMGLVAAVFYYLNIGDNQNTKIANEDPAESTFERLMQKKFDFHSSSLGRKTNIEFGSPSNFVSGFTLDGNNLATWHESSNGIVNIWKVSSAGFINKLKSISSPHRTYDESTFGSSLILRGDFLGIGSHLTWISNPHDGRFYIYNWTNNKKVSDFNPQPMRAQRFGKKSTISSDVFAVTEPGAGDATGATTFYALNGFKTKQIFRFKIPGKLTYANGGHAFGDYFVTTFNARNTKPQKDYIKLWKVERDEQGKAVDMILSYFLDT
jgi:hypothetical protein